MSERTPDALAAIKKDLKDDGITHIVCLAEGLCLYPDDFVYHQIRIADNEASDIHSHFEGAFKFIDDAM